MNHSFLASSHDPLKCGMINRNRLCMHPEVAHTDKGECDYCDYIGVVDADAKNNLACPDCIAKVQATPTPIPTGNIPPPMSPSAIITQSRANDGKVQIRTDLHNAATLAVVKLKEAIAADESITNKPFALATEITNRINHFKQVIFEHNEVILAAVYNQKELQSHLNLMANQLRAEEREKLKIQDVNYKPRDVKAPITVKQIKQSAKKIDKSELRAAASELGIPEFNLRMVMLQKNWTVAQAVTMFKKTLADAKAKMAAEAAANTKE